MKSKILFLTLLGSFFFIPTNATHIIGGEISYQYLGSDDYEITLNLYRDCFYGCCDLPDPETVRIYDALGSEIPGSPFDFPRISYDTLDLSYNNICFIPPTDICVQGAVYIDTLNLPPIGGGYQIKWRRC